VTEAEPASLFASTIADGAYPLPGYARRNIGRVQVVAKVETMDALTGVVATHGTLYAWASQQPQAKQLRGRAPVYVAALSDDSATTVVIRHSWHGGLLAPITGDRFFRPTRAPVELLRAYMLRECGIPTPEVIGFALYPAGPALSRVDVATRYIPNAHDLAEVLTGKAPNITRPQAMDALHVLLAKLAHNGFTHPDLNVKNILYYFENDALTAAVLDVDVMRWDRTQPAPVVMMANFARLNRSLRKSYQQFGVTFTDEEYHTFLLRMNKPGRATASEYSAGSEKLESPGRS
jgi:3-deoxy-D-manno-octulosonic acid kinase